MHTALTLTRKWKQFVKGLSASHLHLCPDSVTVNGDQTGRRLSAGMRRALPQTGITMRTRMKVANINVSSHYHINCVHENAAQALT